MSKSSIFRLKKLQQTRDALLQQARAEAPQRAREVVDFSEQFHQWLQREHAGAKTLDVLTGISFVLSDLVVRWARGKVPTDAALEIFENGFVKVMKDKIRTELDRDRQ